MAERLDSGLSEGVHYGWQGESAISAIDSSGNATINITPPRGYTHWFAAVEFFQDVNGDNQAEPDSGTLTFTIKSPVLPEFYQAFTSNTVDLSSANAQVNWGSPTCGVRVVLSGVSGDSVSHARLRISGHVS